MKMKQSTGKKFYDKLFSFFPKFSQQAFQHLSIFWSELSHLALIPKSQQEVRGS